MNILKFNRKILTAETQVHGLLQEKEYKKPKETGLYFKKLNS